MALDRNLIITVEDYDTIRLNRKISFFKDTVISLDISINDINNNFDINYDTEFYANVVFINSQLERYYDRSKNIPVKIAEDGSLNFTTEIIKEYTDECGILKMQITITDYDMCNVPLPVIEFPIKPTLLEEDEGEVLEIEATDVLNDIVPDGVYDDNDALGAKQAAEILERLDNKELEMEKALAELNKRIADADEVTKLYEEHLAHLEDLFDSQITKKRIAEIEAILEKSANVDEMSNMKVNIKDIYVQLETLNAYVANRVTSKEFGMYQDNQKAEVMNLTQMLNRVEAKVDSNLDDYTRTREADLKNISENFTELEADLNELKIYEEDTKKLANMVTNMNDTMKDLIGGVTEDGETPVLRTYRIMKLKMYKNNQLAIMSDTGEGNSIRVVDGHDVYVNFANEVESVFIATVSPYSRLKFLLKSLEPKKAVIKCFNMEEVIEDVMNEVTQQMEQQITYEVGDMNIHDLPVGLEVHILYLA